MSKGKFMLACLVVSALPMFAEAAPPNNGGSTTARFTVLPEFNNQAVQDNLTGLIWERSPDPGYRYWGTTPETFDRNADPWYCALRQTGGKMGWRLPAVHELASLIQPGAAYPALALPAGHPFLNIQAEGYYRTSTKLTDVGVNGDWRSFVVQFSGGDVFSATLQGNPMHVWCVHGPRVE